MQLQQQLQQTHQTAQQLMQKADAQIATLQAQVVHAEERLKGKAGELAIKTLDQENKAYDNETKRLAAVGQIDPMSLQIIVRQMVQDMLQTDIIPHLQAHADIESGLQQQMPPPMPPDDGNGNGGNGAAQGQMAPPQ